MTPELVTAFRQQLWRRGHLRPVPVVNWNATGPSPGKRPVGAAWQEEARHDPPTWAIQAAVVGALNTGCLADGLRPVDLDIDNEAINIACTTHALNVFGYPPTYRYRTNSPRKLLPYRAADGQPTKRSLVGRLGKIEVLGLGQQFVIDGMHDSGVPIRWSNGSLGEVRRGDLPPITEDQITMFFALCAPLIEASSPKANGAGPHEPTEPQASIERVTEMLNVIPNSGAPDWEYWNRIGMAAWAASGGSADGFRAWDEWSARHPAYDARATQARWHHYHRSPPKALGFGTLFFEADQARRSAFEQTGFDPGASNGKTEHDPWGGTAQQSPPPEVDPGALRRNRRSPVKFPFDVLGERWARWVLVIARAASCPPDYVIAPLLAVASALIGNARHVQGSPEWTEPPILWIASIGDSGSGKSPGGDVIFSKIVPVLERRMARDFPDRHREWETAVEIMKARKDTWEAAVRAAQKNGQSPPDKPDDLDPGAEPQKPRLRMNDVTIEKVATLLAHSAPKGLLMVRDELAGFFFGMNAYNDAARAFWLETYGGRPWTVDRQKLSEPIDVPAMTCSWFGTIQPDRLGQIMKADSDDGLFARFWFVWPDRVPFKVNTDTPDVSFATEALDRLRALEMYQSDGRLMPVVVPVVSTVRTEMEEHDRKLTAGQESAEGLLNSAYGKMRGLTLRLALVLEFLWWAAEDIDPFNVTPPCVVSEAAYRAACRLVLSYVIPMCDRVYRDATETKAERTSVTLARWIRQQQPRPVEIHVPTMRRKVRLPELTQTEDIHKACEELVEAGWLLPLPKGSYQQRARAAYPVNPALWEALR